MKIGYIASEITPFASSGGLGEMAAALPHALCDAGHTVWRAMPFYRSVREMEVEATPIEANLFFPMGEEECQVSICKLNDDSGITTYFVEQADYFNRRELYGDYRDNFERFLCFQKAVVALIDALDLNPDLVHCNDWQTGWIPFLLKYGNDGEGRAATEKTLFTIHNLAYQGIFAGANFATTNLPTECFRMETAEYYGAVNSLKAGVVAADGINTVSPGYAQEIQTEGFGCGLEAAIKYHSNRLTGILNGVDYSIWNPAEDNLIEKKYSPDDLSGKEVCKRELIRQSGLDIKTTRPLLGMVTRLDEQKGIDLLLKIVPELLEKDLGIVILGSGDASYEARCKSLMNKYPRQFWALVGFDQHWAHKIFAGSDIFLQPSQFEPCGLGQMYALKYGTIPIVHAVGGLADTIVDCQTRSDSPEQNGNGFVFSTYRADNLQKAIERALDLFENKANWKKVMLRAMRCDFSMRRMAENYIALYRSLCKAD